MNLLLLLNYFLIFVLGLHGLVHLIAFMNNFGIAEVKGFANDTIIHFSNNVVLAFSVLWLVVGAVFLLSALGLSLNKDWWLPLTFVALIISQVLIVLWWNEAKFGTIPNILILASVLLTGASNGYIRNLNDEVRSIFTNLPQSAEKVVTRSMLEDYPEPLQRYFTYTGIIGTPIVHSVRLKQTLRMRDTAEQPWMDMVAEQYYSIDNPAFIWKGTVKKYGIPVVRVRDRYQNGKGNMNVKALSFYTMADSGGPEMDTGAMLRYFNEMMWFPTALLGHNVSFRSIDDSAVEGTFTDQGKSVTAVFYFDNEGKLVNFKAERYRALNHGNDGYVKAVWVTPITEYKEFNGLRLPSKGRASYEELAGEFTYGELELTDLQYNIPELY